MTSTDFDVIVIGGGAAGLSGAIQLARQRRTVLVIDSGSPRNAPAAAMHGFLGHDGLAPTELLRLGRTELDKFGGQLITGTVTGVSRDQDRFEVRTDDRTLTARRVLVATGVQDQLPEVAGLWDHWGDTVIHCPFCHGWEVRDQQIAVIGMPATGLHQAMLFAQLTSQLTFISHELTLTDEHRADLAALGATVVEGRAEAVIEDGSGALIGVLVDGRPVDCQVVVAPTRPTARVDFLAELGITAADHPSGMGAELTPGPDGRLAPGIWSAGNVSAMSAQVMASAAQGAMAGAQIHADLMAADLAAARAIG